MKTKTINMRGFPCPKPMIEAKKELSKETTEGILVMVDNMPSVQNLEKFSKSINHDFSYVKKSNTVFEVTIIKTTTKSTLINHQQLTTNHQSPITYYGVSIGRDTMGDGEKELGKILIKGFIYSLTELETPPKFIAFLNSGVFLTNENSNTIDDLKQLKEKGVEILSCGTCLNYYNLKKPAVGEVANMYEIVEKLSSTKTINI
ncbi:MAG: sulfurtransferase-like selenium metabolism protein YedF [Firmicutes bacterium]|nr:sulfurtransferase-like selenium metabolism protein YedF [Bacillota bacterium]